MDYDPSSPPDEVLLVVVGAGASHDCVLNGKRITGDITPSSHIPLPAIEARYAIPPLTRDLVRNTPLNGMLIDRYASCQPVIAKLRSALADKDTAPSLEEALAAYRDQENPQVERHLMG